jgi:hypothetical protein
VPALTFGVSTNFALANFLASRSFGNVSVALACVRFPGPRSNETYHVPLDLSAIMRRSRGNSSKVNEIRSPRSNPATCRPSGFVFRGGRCSRTAFRAKTHQRRYWSQRWGITSY